jgi:cyclopropane-fatty-acyl-phospholipid synthase
MALILMFLGWLYQVKSKNAGIVDAIWSYGIMLASVYYAITGSGDVELRILVALIGGLWFLRLGSHIFLRMLSETEDGRYAYVRELYGEKTNLFHAGFFFFQAGLIVLFSLPMWLVSQYAEPHMIAMATAVIIIAIALLGEYQADHQLHLFRSDPSNKGKTCRTGLWKYSRHPNYFFEWCHWFAYPVMAIGMPEGVWLWLAPVCMLIFLWFITGIPFTEKQALKSRGDDYKHYQKTTSPFFPWPPKKY